MRFWFVKSFTVKMLPAMVVLHPVIHPKGEGGWCFCRRRGGGGRVCVLLWEQSAERNFWFLLFLQQTITIYESVTFPSQKHELSSRFLTLFSLPLISGRFCLREFWPLFSPPPHLLLLLLPEKPHTHAHTNADTRAREGTSLAGAHTHTHARRKKTLRCDLHSLGGRLPALARAPTRPVSVPSGT